MFYLVYNWYKSIKILFLRSFSAVYTGKRPKYGRKKRQEICCIVTLPGSVATTFSDSFDRIQGKGTLFWYLLTSGYIILFKICIINGYMAFVHTYTYSIPS